VLLSLDNDVDLYMVGGDSEPGMRAYLEAGARAWLSEVPKFRRSGARMLSSVDIESPVNTGVMWLKPDRALYEEGVALLHTMRFSPELGFNMSGRPRELMPPELAADEAVNATRLMRTNTWNIVGGASDQGLFTLIFGMRHPGYLSCARHSFAVHHFWARSKPWVAKPSCAPYFHTAGLITDPRRGPDDLSDPPRLREDSPARGQQCYPLLRAKAEELLAVNHSALTKRGKVSKHHPWRCRGASFSLF
jgi:hypothetical protein